MYERLLQRIWRAQRFGTDQARTISGASLQVVYRGRTMRSPGPDFRGAALVFDGDLRHGDVELHLRTADWDAHRHGKDHRYDNVILHVVYESIGASTVQTAGGGRVDCLPIADVLGNEAGWTDLAHGNEENCRCLIAGVPAETIGARLDALGDERLVEKAERLEAEAAGADPEQVYYEALLDALGYSQNREPFCELARRLPMAYLNALTSSRPAAERLILLQSLLLGVSGLLPSQRHLSGGTDWAEDERIEELEKAWLAFGVEWLPEVMSASDWSFAVRPPNSPVRRIVGLAVFLTANLGPGLLQSAWRALSHAAGGTGFRTLVDSLSAMADDPYWSEHYDFGRTMSRPAPYLIGRQRSVEIAVNVCLPGLIAFGDQVAQPKDCNDAVWRAYWAAPKLAPNEVTNWMLGEVLGPRKSDIVRGARRQQGLHEQFAKACDSRDCDSCRLVHPTKHNG